MKTPSVLRHSPFAIAAVAAMLAAPAACRAAGAAFAYQGVLADAAGAPLTGPQTIELRLYASAEGGSPLWGRAYNVQLDTNGLFNAEVSDATGSALADAPAATLASVFAASADTTIHIGLKVVPSSGEILPRQTLLAVPYATFAQDLASTSGDLSVAGTLTAASLSASNGVSAASFAVSGALGAASVASSGDASVGGDLSVGGTISGFGTAPLRCIMLWSGAANEVPSGWALCNGQTVNGIQTPDLRGRFLVGAGGAYSVGQTGGEDRHTLTVEEMPSHNHSYSFKGADLKGSWDNDNYFYNQSEKYSGNSNTRWTDSAGGGQSHENRPPFYALCYIMRVR